jgi:hypothetical protein
VASSAGDAGSRTRRKPLLKQLDTVVRHLTIPSRKEARPTFVAQLRFVYCPKMGLLCIRGESHVYQLVRYSTVVKMSPKWFPACALNVPNPSRSTGVGVKTSARTRRYGAASHKTFLFRTGANPSNSTSNISLVFIKLLFPQSHSLLLIGCFKMVDKITPTDPRIQFKTANLNGVTYGYILAELQEKAVDTIFLVHGWPDLALGWR